MSCQPLEPQREHRWLQQLVGEWTYEGECNMGPGKPPESFAGTESVRSVGDLWILGEGRGTTPGGEPAISFMTLGFDPQQQKTQTYTGMGFDINVHDQWAVESLGPIQDRTREHLGSTDKAIINYRSMLMKAIDQVEQGGEKPLMVLDGESARAIRGPITVDGVAPTAQWQAYWREADARKRRQAPWLAQAAE